MRRNHWMGWVLGLAVTLATVGCGGGGGGSAPAPGQAARQGVITSLDGGVTVGGTVVQTTPATRVAVDDDPSAGVQALKVGMVVSIKGSVDGGETMTAADITFRGNLEGPVEAIDLAAATLTVLGQTVQFDDLTVFEGATAADLAVGNIVEVSGFAQADGTIVARLVEFEAATFDAWAEKRLEVKGQVKNLNADLQTFELGSLTVDYSAATLEGNLVLADGLLVEVKSIQNLTAEGVLVASRIEAEGDTVGHHAGLRVELEGLVTRFVSAADFDVNGHPVAASDQTQYRNGTAADLALDARLEVKGTLDAQGVLVADKISFRVARNVKIDADVVSVDPIAGTVQVLGANPGLTVTMNASTLLHDRANEVTPFTLADLAVGDRVSIRGSVSGGGVVASKLERRSPPADPTLVRLQGPVDAGSPADPLLSILGVGVDTTDAVLFRGAEEQTLTRAQFFDALAAGTAVVKVKGSLGSDGQILAQELSLVPQRRLDHEGERGECYRFDREQEGDCEMGHRGGGR